MEKGIQTGKVKEEKQSSSSDLLKTQEEMTRLAESLKLLQTEIDGVLALLSDERKGDAAVGVDTGPHRQMQLQLHLQQLYRQLRTLKEVLNAEGSLFRLDSALEEGGSARLN